MTWELSTVIEASLCRSEVGRVVVVIRVAATDGSDLKIRPFQIGRPVFFSGAEACFSRLKPSRGMIFFESPPKRFFDRIHAARAWEFNLLMPRETNRTTSDPYVLHTLLGRRKAEGFTYTE